MTKERKMDERNEGICEEERKKERQQRENMEKKKAVEYETFLRQ
jgi:hypothetical protein